jgi:predicted transcriptional regulator
MLSENITSKLMEVSSKSGRHNFTNLLKIMKCIDEQKTPTKKVISNLTGMCPEKVKDCARFLEEKGFIKTRQAKGGGTHYSFPQIGDPLL